MSHMVLARFLYEPMCGVMCGSVYGAFTAVCTAHRATYGLKKRPTDKNYPEKRVFDNRNRNSVVKDFCWWDLGGVFCVCLSEVQGSSLLSVCAVVDGSLDLSARATSFFI
jgi:hypothetical protein